MKCKELGAEAVCRAMQNMLDFPDALSVGLRALATFSMTDVDNCLLIRDHGGITLALSALDQFRAHAQLQFSGCLMIANLTRYEDLREPVADAGAVETVLATMEHYRADDKLQFCAAQVRAVREPRESRERAVREP
jgi:hypothetical protein